MKRWTISQVPHLVHGRTNGETDPLTLFWTASGLEVNVRGGELWVELSADWSMYEPWYSFVVNGEFLSRRMAEKGTHRVCVFRGMNPETVKNVRIVKDTQAMSGDPESLLQICALETDGGFEPVEPRALKLEFIGDSITSGEGSIGAKAEEDWVSMFFCAENNYAVMTAQAVGADVRILSQSGWGVGCAWDNNPHNALPPVYEQVCGLLTGARNEALGAHKPNDFAAWQPDYIFINLGTNDCGAFDQPAWRDPQTGESFENRRAADGSFCAEDIARLQRKAKDFLYTLRRCNPKAELVWIYGMLGLDLAPALQGAVEAYRAESGDAHAAFLALTDDIENRGCRNHPGVGAHRTAAAELTAYLNGRRG